MVVWFNHCFLCHNHDAVGLCPAANISHHHDHLVLQAYSYMAGYVCRDAVTGTEVIHVLKSNSVNRFHEMSLILICRQMLLVVQWCCQACVCFSDCYLCDI